MSRSVSGIRPARFTPPIAWALSALCLMPLACSTSGSQAGSHSPSNLASSNQELREPFTRYFEIEVDGEVRGYLLSYPAPPSHFEGTRSLPDGSHRIQNLGFEDIGFISPLGEVRRHTRDGVSEAVGRHELVEGLAAFYDSSSVTLRPLKRSRPEPVRVD